mmetsp:Transcript_70115/g.195002  ORF Transcript_70115/g.195002 Transcript_70115/m.195002 type:complete len:227 (-) Transcript_70115:190-870(-)
MRAALRAHPRNRRSLATVHRFAACPGALEPIGVWGMRSPQPADRPRKPQRHRLHHPELKLLGQAQHRMRDRVLRGLAPTLAQRPLVHTARTMRLLSVSKLQAKCESRRTLASPRRPSMAKAPRPRDRRGADGTRTKGRRQLPLRCPASLALAPRWQTRVHVGMAVAPGASSREKRRPAQAQPVHVQHLETPQVDVRRGQCIGGLSMGHLRDLSARAFRGQARDRAV